jgi:peroxiredoxin Q/BCP
MSAEPAVALAIGSPAPDFTLPADGDGRITLSAFRGRPVVLYFYPKDDTSGCTKEACAFRDLWPDFTALDAVVIGVSKDSPASHDRFRAKYTLPFSLASDSDATVAQAFGVWGEKSYCGRKYMGMDRATFVIDGQGVIRAIWRKVKVAGHAEAVAAALRTL